MYIHSDAYMHMHTMHTYVAIHIIGTMLAHAHYNVHVCVYNHMFELLNIKTIAIYQGRRTLEGRWGNGPPQLLQSLHRIIIFAIQIYSGNIFCPPKYC